ncbi:MAG: SDR family oxidoreductase [Bdellovibrionales bacterium]|nr:SDR family oxidoreductase [Bdellovibrionales bacterium]
MKTALITGASAGLGAEFAKIFAKDGHSVVLVARRKDRLEELSKELKSLNSEIQVHVLPVDLSKPGAAKEVVAFTEKQNIAIDFLVNNAGFGSFGHFSQLEINKELEMIDLNVRVLVELTHYFMKPMLERKFGRILNVGSTAGFQPGPFMSTYYASKAFVNSFSEALSYELKDSGVTCTVLAPGPTQTEFMVVAKLQKSKLFNYVTPAGGHEVAKAGYEAMNSGQPLCVPGIRNKLLIQTLRVSPRTLVRNITASLNQM